MNYIGSKLKLSEFIKNAFVDIVGSLNGTIFCDLFAGTGIIGRTLKKDVQQVISNDIEYFSYVLNKNYIENNNGLKFEEQIKILNNLEGIEGKIFNNYCLGSGSGRQYFSDENGKRIDAIRQKIESWRLKKEINDNQFYFLMASLLESTDKVANTASVYAAFLKNLKTSAQKPLVLEPAFYEKTLTKHLVYNQDANQLVKKIEGDILYLDPPYNSRQYGNYYHILNSIAKYDDFVPRGITGMRDYNKSQYCRPKDVQNAFSKLIEKAKFKYIFMSYNDEGLMSKENVRTIMSRFGKYELIEKKYQRFKADKDANRKHLKDHTTEFLHILIK